MKISLLIIGLLACGSPPPPQVSQPSQSEARVSPSASVSKPATPSVPSEREEQLVRSRVGGTKPAAFDASRERLVSGIRKSLSHHNLIADGSFEGQIDATLAWVWIGEPDAVQVEAVGRGPAGMTHNVLLKDIGKPREIQQSIKLRPFSHYALAASVETSAQLASGHMKVIAVASEGDPLAFPAGAP